jgi:hypothetical protein
LTAFAWAVLCLTCAPPARASDYAMYLEEPGNYIQGTGIGTDWITKGALNDPSVVAGPPTVDTTGDGYAEGTGSASNVHVPVVAVYQAFREFEVVAIGTGGRLILEFDHDITNDPLNPCGVDFIVYGNARMEMDGTSFWQNGNPNIVTTNGNIYNDPAAVSVSSDGLTWHTFSNGPYADDFAPTLGRIYDPQHPDPIVPANQWWGEPTDPTYPLNPNLTAASFQGLSVAAMARKYGWSAGGTSFDIGQLGLSSFRYIKIERRAGERVPEIDAVVAVVPRAIPDLDCDSDVDADDLQRFMDCATGPGLGPPAPGCERADFDRDGDVDSTDFARLQRCWSGPDARMDRECMSD